ncbi:sulfotransferase family 2 domain-containing protein [Gilvimarinus sp. DA14]|uniref:sulfotransferase family 2 domain-containing protein n=1 Tax=Gilvimarinus sp. DA14 TaxID=2956798 RepID=UPI0020B752B3|nr:sulfotransferase family 2 domain-containing protein [Gilvimarinus sp. DA14]UTF59557.1 sulfotransferase family protein [Gilvimarinus sp. DA14]
MIKRDPAKPIIFMHIPKTAGSTLHQLFHLNFKRNEIYTLGITGAPTNGKFSDRHKASIENLYSLGKSKLSGLKAVIGHMPYGLHEAFDSDAQYITVLRHPISRILSHYNFVKENSNHYLHERLKNEAPTVGDYVERLKSKELNNGMLRFFLGRDHNKIPFDGCHREMIEIALDRVEKRFVNVGIQEHFEDSVKLICKSNNWESLEIESKNISKSKYTTTLDKDEAESILRYNSLDLLLYEEIRRRFLEGQEKTSAP